MASCLNTRSLPEEFGMRRRESVDSLRIESPEESLAMLRASLDYSHEDAGDIVALNAGAAIYAARYRRQSGRGRCTRSNRAEKR